MSHFQRIAVRHHGDNILVVGLLDKRLCDPLLVDQLLDELKELLREVSPAKNFILDFEVVTFLITNALNCFLVFNAQIARGNGRLALCRMMPNIREIFQRTCLEENVFHIADSLDRAIEDLQA